MLFGSIQAVLDGYCRRNGGWTLMQPAAKAAMDNLSATLRNLRPENLPAYNTPPVHFAYLHRYAAVRSQMVHDLLSETPVLINPPADRNFVITSVGGGPGSDLMGIAKRVGQRFNGRINYHSVDAEPSWARPFMRVQQQVDPGGRINVLHHYFDFASGLAVPQESIWLAADVLILSYVVSEIVTASGPSLLSIRSLLTQLRPGAFVIYADNRNDAFSQPFLAAATASGIAQLSLRDAPGDDYTMGHCPDEESGLLAEYNATLGHPQTRADATRFVGNKIG